MGTDEGVKSKTPGLLVAALGEEQLHLVYKHFASVFGRHFPLPSVHYTAEYPCIDEWYPTVSVAQYPTIAVAVEKQLAS